MCLGVYIPAGRKATGLRAAERANPDGTGMMFSDISTVLHFRSASASEIGPEYIHPFFVNDNLAFVHNGNFPEFMGRTGKSDTMAFNDEVLKRLPDGFLQNAEIRSALENYCAESFSKMIFMDSTGHVEIIHEVAGQWVDGCWYSNGGIDGYTGYGYSGAYYYNADDVRHKGGLPDIEAIPEGRRDNWALCSLCDGWHPKERMTDNVCAGCLTLEKLRSFCE